MADVRVHTGPDASQITREHSALAVTVGHDIYLGGSVPNSKNAILAHEVAHVAQQQVGDRDVQAKREIEGPSPGRHEHEADVAALAIMSGRPASITPTSVRVAAFAPSSHRAATATGLASSGYTAAEIGHIFASNWERDFSQAATPFVQAVLAWKNVKASSVKRGGNPSKETADTFKAAVLTIVNLGALDMLKESYSGYFAHEHMDNPGGDKANAANERWRGKAAAGLQGYIADAIAYIKDQMIAAVNVYRDGNKLGELGTKLDNWKGVDKPDGYDAARIATAAVYGDTMTPALSTDIIRHEAAGIARVEGADAAVQSDSESALWRVVGHHLGRAMHSFEDFWAHSNWLELAKQLKNNGKKKVSNAELFAGTFETQDKLHALGHKLQAMTNTFLNDFDLMLAVYNRSGPSARLDPDKKNPWYSPFDSDSENIFDGLENRSEFPEGELFDLLMSADNMEILIDKGAYEMEDFMCNRAWLEALNAKAANLIKLADEGADEHGHGKIAKDQDEGDKDHDNAQKLAARANELAFGPLRAIMNNQDAKQAEAALRKQLGKIDELISAPSPKHPLWGLVPS